MAYRRSARVFAGQLFAPSFFYLHQEDDRKNPRSDENVEGFLQNPSFDCFHNNTTTSLGFRGGVNFRDPKSSQFLHVRMPTNGLLLARSMSSTIGAEKINEVADVVADKTMEVVSTQAPVVREVASDSWLQDPGLQYAMFGCKCNNSTGMGWLGKILIVIFVIRTLFLPGEINKLKETVTELQCDLLMEEKARTKMQAKIVELMKKMDNPPNNPPN